MSVLIFELNIDKIENDIVDGDNDVGEYKETERADNQN